MRRRIFLVVPFLAVVITTLALSTQSLKPPTPNVLDKTLNKLIAENNRPEISAWMKQRTVNQINQAVRDLKPEEKTKLAEIVLQITGAAPRQEIDEARGLLKQALIQIITKSELGFYAGILSDAIVYIEGQALEATCGKIFLSPQVINNNTPPNSIRDTLMHEAFHSFSCQNGGPGSSGKDVANPLEEGAAIWIFKAAFPEGRDPNELTAGWAEAVYGTKNFYRDIGMTGYPKDIPLITADQPTPKLLEVYRYLALNDPSHLPWDSEVGLQKCYDKFYQPLKRNVDVTLWLKETAAASEGMKNGCD